MLAYICLVLEAKRKFFPIYGHKLRLLSLNLLNLVENPLKCKSLMFLSMYQVVFSRSTFHCSQSNLESLILKQILSQELSDAVDVLILTDPAFCCAYVTSLCNLISRLIICRRFFKKAMEPNLKKFSKCIRSTFELTELASRVHAVGLQYNPGPFPFFERHELVPQGFKTIEDE